MPIATERPSAPRIGGERGSGDAFGHGGSSPRVGWGRDLHHSRCHGLEAAASAGGDSDNLCVLVGWAGGVSVSIVFSVRLWKLLILRRQGRVSAWASGGVFKVASWRSPSFCRGVRGLIRTVRRPRAIPKPSPTPTEFERDFAGGRVR